MIFSMYQNGKKLFSTSDSGNPMSFLNGMRFISIAWIIFGHTYLFGGISLEYNDSLMPLLAVLKTYKAQLVHNAARSVDTFLFMSGLLVTYVVFRTLKETGHINPIAFYLHRYWRLLPPLAMVISWIAILEPLIVSGPTSTVIHTAGNTCRKKFWKNLLFINNFGVENVRLCTYKLGRMQRWITF